MRGGRMFQRTCNDLRRVGGRCDVVTYRSRRGLPRCRRQRDRRASYLASLLFLALTAQPIRAQVKPPELVRQIKSADIAEMSDVQQTPSDPARTPPPPAQRSITISDAVSIFLQQNLQLVAARYDIDTAEAEKLTAR